MILILFITLEIILMIDKRAIKLQNEIIIYAQYHSYSFGDSALEKPYYLNDRRKQGIGTYTNSGH